MGCNHGHNFGAAPASHDAFIEGLKKLEPRYNAVVAKIKELGMEMPREVGASKYQNIFCWTFKDADHAREVIEKWEDKLDIKS